MEGTSKKKEWPTVRLKEYQVWYERILFIVALVGILTAVHFNLTAATNFEESCLFGVVESSGCQAALESAVGKPLGVSNAIWGLVFFIVVAGLGVAIVGTAREKRGVFHLARAVLIGFGFLYSLFLTAYQFLVLPARCPLCLISAALVTTLFIVQIKYLYHQASTSGIMDTTSTRKNRLFYGGLAVLVLLLIGADALYFNHFVDPALADTPATEAQRAPAMTAEDGLECTYDPGKAAVEDFEGLIGEDDPFKGNPDASVTIVEFFDPNCPHCKGLHPTMEATMDAYAERVRLVYKPVSLPQFVQSPLQNAVLFAAAEAGKFSEMLDLQFDAQKRAGLSWDELRGMAREVGMDPEAMEQRIRDGAYDEIMQEQHEQARAIGLTGVPAVILNGRFVASKSRTKACLSQLIDEELQNSQVGN